MASRYRYLPLLLAALLLHPTPSLVAQIPLPTPLEHYENYNSQAAAFQLLNSLLSEMDAEQRQQAMALAAALRGGRSDQVTPQRLSQLLKTIDWQKHRHQILLLALDRSEALAVVPKTAQQWVPIIHDALLFFLDNVSQDRLLERLAGQIRLPQDTPRSQRILAFAERTPSLQKIGQIMARYPSVPADVRAALQTLENSISTTSRDELVAYISEELGPETIEAYQIEFADEILAEASVGAVIEAELTVPGQGTRRRAVCKAIKAYAIENLQEDLEIMDGLTRHFEEHASFYELGSIPLSDMFQEVKNALAREVQVVEEQANLRRAYEYYSNDPKVKVPEILPPSNQRITFMEFIEGGKITSAFPGDAKARKRLASRLADILMIDVIFAKHDEALFHGDPHAGNVYSYARKGERDPYRIALLDWGLAGMLPRTQRKQLIQLLLGVYLKDGKRLRNNLSALVEGEPDPSPEARLRRREIVDQALADAKRAKVDPFTVLGNLSANLAQEGYSLNFNLLLFIKSQITIIGILEELDPNFKIDKHTSSRIRGQILKETPQRLLNTVWFPGWTSHSYASMLSNEDIRDAQFKAVGGAFKKVGGWIWKGISLPFR